MLRAWFARYVRRQPWRRLARWTALALGLGILVASSALVGQSWYSTLSSPPGIGDSRPEWNYGGDFAIFHTAGRLAADDRWSALYDPQRFPQELYGATAIRPPTGTPTFPYPPPFAIALIPLSHVPITIALGLWSAAGAAGLVVALRLLGVQVWLAPLFLLSVPALMSGLLGQNTFFVIVVLAAAARFAEKQQSLGSGLVTGLLLLKPQLGLGFLLWWLAAPLRRSKFALGTISTATLLGAGSWLLAPDAWGEYIRHFASLADLPGFSMAFRTDGLAFFAPLMSDGAGMYWVAWLAFAVAASLLFMVLGRQIDGAAGVAAAAVASLVIAPHVVLYDWVVLYVPLVIAWQKNASSRPFVLLLGSALAMIALIAPNAAPAAGGLAGGTLLFPSLIVGSAILMAWLVPMRTGAGGDVEAKQSPEIA